MAKKFIKLLFILCYATSLISLVSGEKLQNLRKEFSEILRIPSEFDIYKDIWYAGNHKIRMQEILCKDQLLKQDLIELKNLLQKEDQIIDEKIKKISRQINLAMKNLFRTSLKDLLTEEEIISEFNKSKIKPEDLNKLITSEIELHQKLINIINLYLE